jgi:oligopeptide transport system substrate-binding protein
MKTSFYLAFLLFPLALLFSCTCHNEDRVYTGSAYGGCLRISEPVRVQSLFPPGVTDISGSHLATQLFEGLVRYDASSLTILPAVASSWKIDTSGIVYTFFIHSGARFQDDPCFPGGKGRKVAAGDVKYSFLLLCSQSSKNRNFYGTMDKIAGTRKYYEASAKGKPSFEPEGIKVVNDSVIQIRLEKASQGFIYFLANPAAAILPREGIEKYGIRNLVGTGPFILKEIPAEGLPFRLCKNRNYYRSDPAGSRLPYLDSVIVFPNLSQVEELKMLTTGELDAVLSVPDQKVSDFVASHLPDFNGPRSKFKLETSFSSTDSQNILQKDLMGLYSNSMNYLDLSIVFFNRIPEGFPEPK